MVYSPKELLILCDGMAEKLCLKSCTVSHAGLKDKSYKAIT